METSPNNPQSPPQKVRNILFRYARFSEFDSYRECEHPENLHLLRYFPKYYKSLRLKVTSQNTLLSKIKKIKRIKQIKRLNWASEKGPVKKNWLTLFGNNRRTIQEIPQITPPKSPGLWVHSFWTELSLREARFFYNIRRHSLPVGSEGYSSSQNLSKLPAGKTLLAYLKNMRWRNKRVELYINKENSDQVRWVLERFEKTKGYLPILKMLKIEMMERDFELQELLENKTVFSHLRDLRFFWHLRRFDQNLGMIPQMCRNLRSLSMSFERFFYESPGFSDFLFALQELLSLETLKLLWFENTNEFLKCLKPPTNLKYLSLSLYAPNLMEGSVVESRDLHSYPNLIEHWEDLKELETLECRFECGSHKEVHFMRAFVTMVLRKAPKLKSFICQLCLQEELSKSPPIYEPFFSEYVPHLYESLQRFEANLCDCYFPSPPVKFDLKMLKPFKNLKKIKLRAERQLSYMNVEEAISLLENNQKEDGVVPKLSLNGVMIQSKDELRGILETISKAKRVEKSLKIKLGFRIYNVNEGISQMQDLDECCSVVNSLKPIRNLLLRLNLICCPDASPDEMRRIAERYPEIQNCIINSSDFDPFCYVKIKGTKEQLF